MNKNEIKKTERGENEARLLEGNETLEELEMQERFRSGKKGGKGRGKTAFLMTAVGLAAAVVLVALAVNLSMVSADPEVTAVLAQIADIRQETSVSGTVVSNLVQVCYSPVDAPLSVKLPEAGEKVTAGEMLAEFDTTDLENALAQSSLHEKSTVSENADTVAKADQNAADLEQAAAEASSLKADVDRTQQNIYDISGAISERKSELADNLTGLQNQLLQLQNDQTNLQAEITRMEAEQQSAEISNAEYDETGLNEAREKLKGINQSITSLQQQINSAPTAETDETIADYSLQLQKAQDRLAKLTSDLSEAESRKSAAEQSQLSGEGRAALQAGNDLANLQTMTAEQKLNLAKKGVRAEFDGVVTASAGLDSGSPATEGMELFTISSQSDLGVEIRIPKSDYEKIKTGQTAEAVIGGTTCSGTVESVSSLIETDDKGASYLSAKVRLENPDESVVIGADADVTIKSAAADQVLCIPSECLNSGVGGDFVYLINDNNEIEKRSVTAGILAENTTEIVSGLSEGDRILKKLPDGMAVGDRVHAVIEKDNA